MKRIMDILSLKNTSFSRKMVVIYAICVLMPLLVLSIFYYCITIDKIKKQDIDELEFSLSKASDTIQNIIDNSIMISDMIYFDSDLYKLLSSKDTDNLLMIANEIDNKMAAFMLSNIIDDIEIYTYNKNLYRNSTIRQFEQLSGQEWYEIFSRLKNNMMVLCNKNERSIYNISIVRYLKPSNGDAPDLLKIDINNAVIVNALRQCREEYNVCMVDNLNRIIATQGTGHKRSIRDTVGDIIDMQDRSIYSSNLNFPIEYKVLGTFDFKISENVLNRETGIFTLLVGIIFCLSTAMILIIMNNVVKQLNNLTECTKKIRQEIFEPLPVEGLGVDEIGNLTRGMNDAIEKINELINDVYKEKIRSIEIEKQKSIAEFNALQCQINPHFMFNLFEVIRMKTLKKGDKETALIMRNISLMLRSLIQWGDDMITINQEFAFIEAFLNTQKYNMDNDVKIDIDIDDDVRDLIIPKMTIQVFVENAFVHGLESIYDDRRFSLSAKIREGRLIIKVSDNGEGMSNELVNVINSGDTDEIAEALNGIGIKNIFARLSLYFRNHYIISASSEPFKKTEITINLPAKRE